MVLPPAPKKRGRRRDVAVPINEASAERLAIVPEELEVAEEEAKQEEAKQEEEKQEEEKQEEEKHQQIADSTLEKMNANTLEENKENESPPIKKKRGKKAKKVSSMADQVSPIAHEQKETPQQQAEPAAETLQNLMTLLFLTEAELNMTVEEWIRYTVQNHVVELRTRADVLVGEIREKAKRVHEAIFDA